MRRAWLVCAVAFVACGGANTDATQTRISEIVQVSVVAGQRTPVSLSPAVPTPTGPAAAPLSGNQIDATRAARDHLQQVADDIARTKADEIKSYYEALDHATEVRIDCEIYDIDDDGNYLPGTAPEEIARCDDARARIDDLKAQGPPYGAPRP